MKIRSSSLFVVISLFFLILSGCSKDEGTPDPEITTGTFIDSRDQIVYNWVKVGTQTWMAENLAYKTDTECWAYDNIESNATVYGYLYTWELAQTVAPEGWHLPSQVEWQTLVDHLGGEDKAYDKLLESGTLHWESPNTGNNDSKFTALPSGYFDQRDNSFNYLGHLTMFHSTTESSSSSTNAIGMILNPNYPEDLIEGRPKMLALPIRCIKN